MGERLITLTLIALAAYRVAHLVAFEDGPYDVARRLRDWLDTWPAEQVAPGVTRDHWVARGVRCPLCTSFWLTLPAARFGETFLGSVCCWLACAGLVLVLHKAVDR